MTIGTTPGVLDWIDSRITTRSRSGAISVTTTAQGLPVEVTIAESALRLGARAIAAQVLALCEQGRVSAGVRLRETLTCDGVDEELLALMGLATADDLARIQSDADDASCAPRSWLR
ncbi:hypothetical protein HUN08_13795 [Gordonia sp. X0973]|uniref:hypothetical protein n=1 Tax=Gordonia sp. X0973 TaxID=2742602 RepID=UPI000F5313F1|nr:hypothetical protein [Gordonia sp. X0973]QKT08143.1 hypothetical protein HUN08_13795 [Gordonia sp. X0973]